MPHDFIDLDQGNSVPTAPPSTTNIADLEPGAMTGSNSDSHQSRSARANRYRAGKLPLSPFLIRTFEHHLQIQSHLALRLEELADRLPADVTICECVALASCLPPAVRRAHAFEEGFLFPVLRMGDPALENSVRRLRFEHCEDEAYADELCEALMQFASGAGRPDAETLAYMLRGFFEGLRRHIAFEREHVLPILVQQKPFQSGAPEGFGV